MKPHQSSGTIYGHPGEDENVYLYSNTPSQDTNFQSVSRESFNNNYPNSVYDNSEIIMGDNQAPLQRLGNHALVDYTQSPNAIQGNNFNYDVNSNIHYQEYSTDLESRFGPMAPSFASSDSRMGSSLATSVTEPSRFVGVPPIKKETESPTLEYPRRSNINEHRKLKDTNENVADTSTDKVKVKSAHNVIEQRYRNKINDKFTALQFSVPTLRAILGKREKLKSEDESRDSESDDSSVSSDSSINLEGLEPATKLNKGTILAKTVEYIKFLENKNTSLSMEHQQLIMRAEMLGLRLKDDFRGNGKSS
ncbi:hypothetical protein JCM33374_g583 [Metschnikowia sp. JCM 33374]|nr:hypothetical protein JCM33374_g583 [Metschnikowia sp. JCM 33374]